MVYNLDTLPEREIEMTVKEAAALIGVNEQRIRLLIKEKRILVTVIHDPRGIVYDVNRASAEEYKNSPRKSGWRKGRSRKEYAMERN
jgi:phage antirepressor YoqD-like protein